jgi:hypothetical protein
MRYSQVNDRRFEPGAEAEGRTAIDEGITLKKLAVLLENVSGNSNRPRAAGAHRMQLKPARVRRVAGRRD